MRIQRRKIGRRAARTIGRIEACADRPDLVSGDRPTRRGSDLTSRLCARGLVDAGLRRPVTLAREWTPRRIAADGPGASL